MSTWDYEDYSHLPKREQQAIERKRDAQSLKEAYGPLYTKYKKEVGQPVSFIYRTTGEVREGKIVWVTREYVKQGREKRYFPQYIVNQMSITLSLSLQN